MQVLSFLWHAKYGHFLRAESNVNALTYAVPPRSAVLGVVAAVLGLEKDALAVELRDLRVAVGGGAEARFWHRVKLRKDPPAPLPFLIKRNQKGSATPERATLIRQEWLWRPAFRIDVALPERPELFAELVDRIRARRWHFTPVMGLSELLAELTFEAVREARHLEDGEHRIDGICPADLGTLLPVDGLGVHLIRLPHGVSVDRVFSHRPYYLEIRGRSFPIRSSSVWQIGERRVVFA